MDPSSISEAALNLWRSWTSPGGPFPGAALTRERLSALTERLSEHGPEGLALLAPWLLSDDPRAVFVRDRRDPLTPLRRGNCESYLERATPPVAPRPPRAWEGRTGDPVEDTSTVEAARAWVSWREGTIREAITRIGLQGGGATELRAWLSLRVSDPDQVLPLLERPTPPPGAPHATPVAHRWAP